MSERREYWVPTDFDVDNVKDAKERERVSALIVKLNNGEITLNALFERFSASVKGEKVLNDDYWDIPIVIASVFHIPSALDINDSIEKILDRLDALEAKLRNHRHETTKRFSSKAEF